MIYNNFRKRLVFSLAILLIGSCIIPISSSVEIERLISISGAPNGNILYVGGSGGENYSTIQEAIDAAISGDTIFAGSGVGRTDFSYSSNLDLKQSIKKLGKVINKKTKVYPGHGPVFLFPGVDKFI